MAIDDTELILQELLAMRRDLATLMVGMEAAAARQDTIVAALEVLLAGRSRVAAPGGNRRLEANASMKARTLYSSPNGDCWSLVRDEAGVFVRHEANPASGGTVTRIELGDFLSRGLGPEQQELLRLMGSLNE